MEFCIFNSVQNSKKNRTYDWNWEAAFTKGWRRIPIVWGNTPESCIYFDVYKRCDFARFVEFFINWFLDEIQVKEFRLK